MDTDRPESDFGSPFGYIERVGRFHWHCVYHGDGLDTYTSHATRWRAARAARRHVAERTGTAKYPRNRENF